MTRNASLPADHHAEQAVLGSILHRNETLADVAGLLTPESFHWPAHRDLFAEMLRMAADGVPVDELTLAQRLKARGELDANGLAYLATLVEQTPVAENALAYAGIVADAAGRRELIRGGTQLARKAQTGREDALALASEAEEALRELTARHAAGAARPIAELARETADLLAAQDPGLPVVKSHCFIDQHIQGFTSHYVSVVGARTGNGKTAFLLHVLLENARHGVPGLFLSMEMRHWECAARLACHQSRVSGARVLKRQVHRLAPDHQDGLFQALGDLGALPMHFAGDGRRLSLGQIRHLARHHVHTHGVRLICVDHLRKIAIPGDGSIYEKQTARIEGLSDIAKELGVVILCAAQINREGDDQPRARDLEGSGAIEQEADVVLLMQKQPKPDRDRTFWMDFYVAKQRNAGPTDRHDFGAGKVSVQWWPWMYRFESGE